MGLKAGSSAHPLTLIAFHFGFTQKGNIFLCDYKSLDGIKANTVNGKQQYLMAPLVLLHRTPDDKLMPIAIQVRRPQYTVVQLDANTQVTS